MSEKRFTLLDETIFDNEKQAEDGGRVTYWVVSYGQRQRLVDLLNEQQAEIDDLKEENKELKHWKKRIIEYLSDWFNKTEYLTVLYKINEINNEIGLDIDE